MQTDKYTENNTLHNGWVADTKNLGKPDDPREDSVVGANCIFRPTWLELLGVNAIEYITVERVKCDG